MSYKTNTREEQVGAKVIMLAEILWSYPRLFITSYLTGNGLPVAFWVLYNVGYFHPGKSIFQMLCVV